MQEIHDLRSRRLICLLITQEYLTETLNEEQKELFEKYLTSANELSIVINEETFKSGYRLATQIMIECM